MIFSLTIFKKSPSKVKKDPSVVRYEGNMRSYNPHDACKDWAVHPIDCIRKAYHNHLKVPACSSFLA